MKIKIFGKLTDIFGGPLLFVDRHCERVIDLKNYIENQYPEAKQYTFIIVVNNKKSENEDDIPANAEVAILPPFSGG